MASSFKLLRCVGRAALNYVGVGVLGNVVFDLADSVMEHWGRETDERERRAELQAIAQATAQEIRQQVAAVVADLPSETTQAARQAVASYLAHVPAVVRQTLRRPSDPSGTTVPTGLTLRGPGDMVPFLPSRMPRFKPGDSPPGIGHRKLVSLLGAGGFGEVWMAVNPEMSNPQPVALKFCMDEEGKKLLHHEADMLQRVQQQQMAGVVALRDTYLHADPPCLEYEYVSGGDLAGLMNEQSRQGKHFSHEQAARLVLQLAKTVGHFHRLGPPIVHRDLKPGNILLQQMPDKRLQPRITDFGIGGIVAGQQLQQKHSTSRSGRSVPTMLRGSYTLLYASPEQQRGSAPDPRDDVHALGVIWYQLLTGDLTAGAPAGLDWPGDLEAQGMPRAQIDLLASCFSSRLAKRPGDAQILYEQLRGATGAAPAARAPAAEKPRPPAAPERKAAPPSESAAALAERGTKAVEAKRYDEALQLLERATDLDPKLADAWYQRGMALLNGKLGGQKDIWSRIAGGELTLQDVQRYANEIKEYFQKACSLQPGNALYMLMSQLIQQQMQQTPVAPAPAQPSAAAPKGMLGRFFGGKGGANAQEMVNQGNKLMNQGLHDAALSVFEKAIQADKNCAAAWYGKGVTLTKTLGNDQQEVLTKIARGEISLSEAQQVGEQAKLCLRKAAKLEPSNVMYKLVASQLQ